MAAITTKRTTTDRYFERLKGKKAKNVITGEAVDLSKLTTW